MFGADPREYLTTVTKIVKDDSGAVKEVHTVNVTWKKDKNGRMTSQPVPGSEKVRPCELLLVAMGFTGPEQTLISELSLDTDARSNIKADEMSHKTNLAGIFAAGDCRRGQSLVVWAIREGREAAAAVDAYLQNK